MARNIPRVCDDSLHVPARESTSSSVIALGSAAWDTWLEHSRSFRFESQHSSFTARKEQRPGGWYWYAYRRRQGKLHIAYLGKSEELTSERLNTVASVLECAEDSTEETRHQSQQISFDASLHTHHTSIIPFPLAQNKAGSLTEAQPILKHNLPVQLTSLVGRESATVTATALLRRPEVRLLSMIGTGGIGKTRLAIGVATELLEDFPDGIFFVVLAPLHDPEEVLPTIAHTLGLKESGSEPVTERLHTYLRDKHLLLVLDNFEHLMPAAPVVGELLTTCPRLKLLVTSREVLHLRAEQQFSVPPLAVPDRKHFTQVQSLLEYPALDLFLQRARAVKHDFQLHKSNAQALTEICIRLDGLPLAIELAAARIAMLSPHALLARLDHRLQVLTHGPTDLPERHQTLRQTIQWSYELLKPEEQRLFQRMSVFAGGATFEAVEAVCELLGDETGRVFDRVTSLLDKCLIQAQEDEEPRLMMLETIREYGVERLAEYQEMEVTREAHAVYYLRIAEDAEPHLRGSESSRWFTRLEQEHENLRAALSWLLERAGMRGSSEENKEWAEQALRLCSALYWFWDSFGGYREGWSFLEQALAVREGVSSTVQLKVLNAAIEVAFMLDDYERAEGLCRETLGLSQQLGDIAGEATALFQLGFIAWAKGKYAQARAQLEESLIHFQELGNTWNQARSLAFLSNVFAAQGEYSRARTVAEESLKLSRALGNKGRIAIALCVLAWARFLVQDDLTQVQALAEQSLTLFRELGDAQYIAYLLRLLGEIRLVENEPALARALLEESVATSKELGDCWRTAGALLAFARLVSSEGELAAAYACYRESLALARQIGAKNFIAAALEGVGAMVAAQGDPVWATRLWGAAEALREAMGAPIPPVYRTDYDRSVAAARAQLGEKAFAAAWSEGRTMSLEQVLTTKGTAETVALITEPSSAPPVRLTPTSPAGLTTREIEVLHLLAKGLTSAQIAEQLILSRLTVNTHVRSIYSKLGVTSRSSATRWALENKLV